MSSICSFLTDFILPWPMVLAKYLAVRSPSCNGDHHSQDCNYFCVTCLTQARRNPLECPSHGPAEPPVGMFYLILFQFQFTLHVHQESLVGSGSTKIYSKT